MTRPPGVSDYRNVRWKTQPYLQHTVVFTKDATQSIRSTRNASVNILNMFSRRSIWHAPGSRSPIGIVCARHPLDTLYAPLDGFCVDDLTFSDRETLSRNLSVSKVIRMSNRHYFNVKSLPIKLIILSFTLSGRNSKLTTKFRELSHRRRTIRIPPAKRRET